ncbi:pre-mRNA-splicing regulator WTAP-like [Thalassophryne amazonica]|uniref:pre-mRNA-splicing regulator WTAP-like n=1 Tax=Thalassophryne amazonica TaxID=390379 RepID=UPI0014724C22|nr:pre-mRNA-splicing regulator WTAP-like [Thalassophryne amazonica]
MPEDEPLPKKVRLSDDDFKTLSREELLKRWKQEDAYVKTLERKYSDLLSNSMTDLKELEEKLTRREKSLIMRLPSKEQELQKCCTQIRYLKRAQHRSLTQLPASDVDPTINLLFRKMRCELDQIKAKLEQAQNELRTGKFTPDR